MAGFLFGYGEYRDRQLATKLVVNLADLNGRLASSTEEWRSEIKVLKENLVAADSRNVSLAEILEAEQRKTSSVQRELEQITGTVGTLEKLSQTDPELLQKYSKVFFLSENYAPPRLMEIDSRYLFTKDKPQQIHTSVWPYLERLLAAATANNITLPILSAYRSFDTQSSLKASYRFTYGAGTANQFSAEQGYSEHQLGTTVDFTTSEIGSNLAGFEKTASYNWLATNAYQYGFVISYPSNNTYYQFEPWHWRFVGVALATELRNTNKFFYDLDQREIDKYLVKIFD